MYYNVICQIYTKLLQNPSINKIVKDIHRFHHKHHHQRSVCKVPPGCPGAAKLPPFVAPPGAPLYIIYDISSLYLNLFIYYELYIYLRHHCQWHWVHFPTLLIWWWVKTFFGASGFYWFTLKRNFLIKSEGGLFRKDNINRPVLPSVTEPRYRLTFILLRGGQWINTLLCCVLMIYGFYLSYIRSSLPVS